MTSELHFNCYILNNKYNYLNLSLGKRLINRKKNNGYILESDADIENIINNKKCCVVVISLD